MSLSASLPAKRSRSARLRLEPLEDRFLPAGINGMMFQDLDGDGVRGAADPVLVGRVLFLDTNGNGLLDGGERRTSTAADGSFSFADTGPGTFTVCQTMPAGWRPSSLTARSSGELSPADKLIRLDQARIDPRFADIDGRGFSVAVLDTGVDAGHPWLKGSIVQQHDYLDGDAVADDLSGHGTHVASLIASHDKDNPGIAPGADIVALKVLDEAGGGSFKHIEAGLRWVIDNAARYNIASVNLSLGDGGSYASATSLHGIGDELAQLNAMGIVVVAAAGNSYGPGNVLPGIAYPAADPSVIAVGAVWDADHGPDWQWDSGAIDRTTAAGRIASFSQRGGAGSQQVFAPGTLLLGAAPGGGTASLTGSSMAAGLVAGLVPLVQQLAVQELGRRLSADEVRTLIHDSGALAIDGDDENDNVKNTGIAYRRIDVLSLLESVLGTGGYRAGSMPQSLIVHVAAGKDTSGIEMGTYRLGRVRGVAYRDSDDDDRRDANEQALAGRLVFADANGNGRADAAEAQARTDSQGRYVLDGLAPGNVTIRVSAQAGEVAPSAVALAVTSGLDRAVDLGLSPVVTNRAPTLSGNGQTLNVIEDAPASTPGVAVGQMLGSSFRDADAGSKKGIAVFGAEGNGRWQFSLDGGRSWSDFGKPSVGAARLLREQDRVRFLPARDSASPGSLRYHAWDQTSARVGEVVSLAGKAGGHGAFSSQAATARALVQALNDAPTLYGPRSMPVTLSNGSPSAPIRVGTLLAGMVRDVDSAGVGLAVQAAAGDGRWQYSRDGGRTWAYVGSIPSGRGLLLEDWALVRFVPRPGSQGTAALTYRAWDRSRGTAGTVDVLGPTGGSSAFSQLSATASMHIRR